MIQIRRLHRSVGLVLLLPFLGWAITGFVFFVKPGYEGAYETLQPKTYPLDRGAVAVMADPSWLEFRYFKTILGNHLIVRTATGWRQLDPATLALRATPTAGETRALIGDAFSASPIRYGQISAIEGRTATTTTDVQVALDWNQLGLQQTGTDTVRIDWLYRIHYLQWTGIKWLDQILGMLGLALFVILGVLGFVLNRTSDKPR